MYSGLANFVSLCATDCAQYLVFTAGINQMYFIECVKLDCAFHFEVEKHDFKHIVTSQPATYFVEVLSLIALNTSIV
jgi:hypothetical protein